MKKILIILTLVCIPALCKANSDLTADDIARHLGLTFWKFSGDQLTGKYLVYLVKIEKGREVSDSNFSNSIAWNPQKSPLVVGVRAENRRLIFTISTDTGTSFNRDIKEKDIFYKFGNSPILIGSPIPLMTDKVNTQEVTGKIEEIDSGIALKISEYKKGA